MLLRRSLSPVCATYRLLLPIYPLRRLNHSLQSIKPQQPAPPAAAAPTSKWDAAVAYTARLVDSAVTVAQQKFQIATAEHNATLSTIKSYLESASQGRQGATALLASLRGNADGLASQLMGKLIPSELSVIADALTVVARVADAIFVRGRLRLVNPVQWLRSAMAMAALQRECASVMFNASSTNSNSNDQTPLSELELYRFSRFAHAIYGRDSLRSEGTVAKQVKGKKEPTDLEIFMNYVYSDRPQRAHISVPVFQSDAGPFRPAHAVVIDSERREIVVCIRGTKTASDLLTNTFMETDAFPPSKEPNPSSASFAHHGMLKSATMLDASLRPALIEALKSENRSFWDSLAFWRSRPAPWRLVFVGHSLGGAVSALLCELWNMSPPAELKNALVARAYGYGMPCALSLDAARACSPRVTAVICDDDVVCRASVGAFNNLVRALAFLAHCRVPLRGEIDYDALVQQCLQTLQQPVDPSSETAEQKKSTQSLASHVIDIVDRLSSASHPLWPSVDNVSALRAKLERIAHAVQAFVIAHRNETAFGVEGAQELLYPPGRLVWLRETLSASPPPPISVDQRAFEQIALSTNMVRAHLAHKYVQACERAGSL